LYTLPLHDALPISAHSESTRSEAPLGLRPAPWARRGRHRLPPSPPARAPARTPQQFFSWFLRSDDPQPGQLFLGVRPGFGGRRLRQRPVVLDSRLLPLERLLERDQEVVPVRRRVGSDLAVD